MNKELSKETILIINIIFILIIMVIYRILLIILVKDYIGPINISFYKRVIYKLNHF